MATIELLANHPLWDEVHGSRNRAIPEIAKLSVWSQKKIWWLGKCGHEWEALIQHRAAKGNAKCPFCANVRFLKGTNDVQTRIPQLMHLWDFKANTDNPADTLYRGKAKFAWVNSVCGHKWDKRIEHMLRDSRCPVCRGWNIVPGVNDLGTTHPRLASKVLESNSSIDVSTLSLRSNQVLHWKCDKCFREFDSSVRLHHDKPSVFCSKCRKGKSSLELFIATQFKAYGIDFIQNSKPIRTINSEGKTSKLEIDFLLVDFELGIEVQDFGSHSKDSDTESLGNVKYRGAGSYKKGPTYHEMKRRLAFDQLGVTIIDVWQDELFTDQWKKKIVDFAQIDIFNTRR